MACARTLAGCARTPVPRPASGLRGTLLVFAVALTIGVVDAPPPADAAPANPVAGGRLVLRLSGGFKRQLKLNGVKMRRSLAIKKGSIDPSDGSGSLTLAGRLKLSRHGRKTSFGKPVVRLGRKGSLRAGGVKLFRLRGGSVHRHGFGSKLKRVGVRLLPRGVRQLNRKLGLHSLHPGRAGTASITVRPKTVRVSSGTVRVVPSLSPGDGAAFKFFDHCVDPILGGITAIPPAAQDSNLNFVFPVQGGTIGPDGRAGLTLLGGGTEVSKDPAKNSGPCAAVPDGANVRQSGLAVDLANDHVFADAVIGGYPPPLGGPKGVAIGFEIDKRQMIVDARPKARKLTIANVELSLSAASATFLNLVLPNSSGNPSRDFMSGDLFGTATMTLSTR